MEELGAGVHLTKGQPAQSSTKLGHKLSLLCGRDGALGGFGAGGTFEPKVSLPKVVPHLGHEMSLLGVWERVEVLGGRGYI